VVREAGRAILEGTIEEARGGANLLKFLLGGAPPPSGSENKGDKGSSYVRTAISETLETLLGADAQVTPQVSSYRAVATQACNEALGWV